MACRSCCSSSSIFSSLTTVLFDEDGEMARSLISWARFSLPMVDTSSDSTMIMASSAVNAINGFFSSVLYCLCGYLLLVLTVV